ncbi:HalOD1 output domain-containing protein [Natronorubrum halophilum]|uniref:HalOD1 output domain-containing protein n=1 Tax=Natronorubrum halophilum TaxID=1702106 RepID=UPI000EF71A85|nr:HalOD1 output domain-containing protein [Natronorubrum halophilum]
MNDAFIGSADSRFDGSVSIAIVTAVASKRDVDPTELPPLYEWIEPDALDALFEPTRRGGPRRGHLEFTYDGHEIGVECGDGLEITVDGVPMVEPVSTADAGHSSEYRTDA